MEAVKHDLRSTSNDNGTYYWEYVPPMGGADYSAEKEPTIEVRTKSVGSNLAEDEQSNRLFNSFMAE